MFFYYVFLYAVRPVCRPMCFQRSFFIWFISSLSCLCCFLIVSVLSHLCCFHNFFFYFSNLLGCSPCSQQQLLDLLFLKQLVKVRIIHASSVSFLLSNLEESFLFPQKKYRSLFWILFLIFWSKFTLIKSRN